MGRNGKGLARGGTQASPIRQPRRGTITSPCPPKKCEGRDRLVVDLPTGKHFHFVQLFGGFGWGVGSQLSIFELDFVGFRSPICDFRLSIFGVSIFDSRLAILQFPVSMFDSGSPIFDFRFPILGFRFSILGFRFSIFDSRSSTVAFRSCRASARNHRFSNFNFGVSICGFRFSTVGLRHSGAWRLTVNGVTSVDSANRHWVWASTTTSDIRRIGKTTTRWTPTLTSLSTNGGN